MQLNLQYFLLTGKGIYNRLTEPLLNIENMIIEWIIFVIKSFFNLWSMGL